MIFSTQGNHFIVELSGCNSKHLTNLAFVENTLVEGVKKAKATLISQNFYQFSPQGVSGILLLAESHCSIHTWPEEGAISIDVGTKTPHQIDKIYQKTCERSGSITNIRPAASFMPTAR